jgi:bacteriocin-like protein
MSNQPENEVLTPQERRQSLLNELSALQQMINELSNEELEQITGGFGGAIRANIATIRLSGNPPSFRQIKEAVTQGMVGIRIR